MLLETKILNKHSVGALEDHCPLLRRHCCKTIENMSRRNYHVNQRDQMSLLFFQYLTI